MRSFKPINLIVASAVVAACLISPIQNRAIGAVATSSAIVSLSTTGGLLEDAYYTVKDVAISGNGRYVVFATDAEFAAGDENFSFDIFRKDLFTGTILPISIDDQSVFADDDSYAPSISADGRYIAFMTNSDELDTYDLLDRDDNFEEDLYVRDTVARTTRLVAQYNTPDDLNSYPSAGDNGVASGSISADGLHVVFTSSSRLTFSGDTDQDDLDVFVRDMAKDGVTRISRNPANNSAGGGSSGSISSNGRFVTFMSAASDITTAPDTNGTTDIFFFDRDTDGDGKFDEANTMTTTRVSVDTAGGATNGPSFSPKITPDGRFVAFTSVATDLVAGSQPGVFVRDRLFSSTTWASPTFGTPDGDFANLTISDSGRYVGFDSNASNLVGGDTPGTRDVFRRDLYGVTARVSVGINGTAPDGASSQPSISANGAVVAFSSNANNLVPVDPHSMADSFVWSATPDTTAPTVLMLRPSSKYTTSGALTPLWYGFDTSSVANFDVQWRIARYDGAFGAWTNQLTASNATGEVLLPTVGRTYCWRSRARDTFGNTSAFSTALCTAAPLRAKALTYSAGWTSVAALDAYGGAYMRAVSANRTATLTNVKAERIALVVTACPTCGSVTVTFANQTKTVSLRAATTVRMKVIEVFALPALTSGTVKLTTKSTAPVYIEGIAAYQD